MKNNYLSFKSELGKAKNWGSAVNGSHHWLMQRLSALLLVLFFVWLVVLFFNMQGMSMEDRFAEFKKPWVQTPLLILLTTSLYHGMLGWQVIVEDYLSCSVGGTYIIVKLKLFIYLTIFTLIISGLYFMLHN